MQAIGPRGQLRERRSDNSRCGHSRCWIEEASHDFAINTAWLTAAMTGAVLLAWLKLLALDGQMAKAEPKTLRYRILHTAARLVRGGRRRRLKVPRTWPWAIQIEDAWRRITALPQAP